MVKLLDDISMNHLIRSIPERIKIPETQEEFDKLSWKELAQLSDVCAKEGPDKFSGLIGFTKHSNNVKADVILVDTEYRSNYLDITLNTFVFMTKPLMEVGKVEVPAVNWEDDTYLKSGFLKKNTEAVPIHESFAKDDGYTGTWDDSNGFINSGFMIKPLPVDIGYSVNYMADTTKLYSAQYLKQFPPSNFEVSGSTSYTQEGQRLKYFKEGQVKRAFGVDWATRSPMNMYKLFRTHDETGKATTSINNAYMCICFSLTAEETEE